MKYLFWILSSCFSIIATGQGFNINITVTDSVMNKPLLYVNLYLKNTGIGASTNDNGIAIISKEGDIFSDTLIVSCIGYNTQSIPILSGETMLEIVLVPSIHLLEEVVVKYKKSLKAKQIVKKAIKNITQNYATQDVILNCFYRETIKEEGRYIQLNEAFADIYYTAYPQKKLNRKIWEDWYYDDQYVFDIEADYTFSALLHDFNTKRDKMQIVKNRSSENWSKYGIETALMGGPLDLTGYDKIKYLYDFLNPKLIRKYNFEKAGIAYINGTTCYVINFTPRHQKRKFHTDQSRKNKHPIYVGKLFIEKESFAVVKYDYRLAVNRNYGFFAKKMPLEYIVEVDYVNTKGFWYLNKISLTELKRFNQLKGIAEKKYLIHEGKKELFILDIEKEKVTEFKEEETFKSTKFSTIRYFRQNYDVSFWEAKNVFKAFPLNKQALVDLEKETPLLKQFTERFQQKDNLKAPIAPKSFYQFKYSIQEVSDSFHWMALPIYKNKLINYLQEENKYAKNFFIPNRRYQHKIFDRINAFYVKEARQLERKLKKGDFYSDLDSLGDLTLYQYIDSTSKEIYFNISAFQEVKKNIRITNIIPNKAQSLLLIHYLRPEELHGFVAIVPKGKLTEIDSLNKVYAIEWLSDSTLLYAKANEIDRSDKLFWRKIYTHKDSLIFFEKDKTFDISIQREYNQIQCTVQSKAENEVYLVELKDNGPFLNLVRRRKNNVVYQVKSIENNWYLLTNEAAANNKLFFSQKSFPFEWQEIISNTKGVYLQDFIITEDYLITKSYENSFVKIEYKHKNEKSWNSIPFEDEIVEVYLSHDLYELNKIRFNLTSPSIPYTSYEYDLSNKKKTELSTEKVQKARRLKSIRTQRIWAKGRDNVKIPITLISSKWAVKQHKGLILKVYGAYGAIANFGFSSEDVILMENGYIIAYAHVRGGGIMGNEWYNQGKLLYKKNSFLDYITCAQYLIKKKYTTSEYLIGYGNSAGGLVLGWAINEYPELFNTVIFDHAYLDVLNTMMDASLPLTTDEYKEWGNPNVTDVYQYIKSYSPYQNIKKQVYPNMLFLASYQDKQTPVWQIAKHAAAIRQQNMGDSNILLLTDMNSGHIGNTTGKEWIKSISRVASFINMNLFKK